MAGIKVNRDNSEIIAYDEPGIPVYIVNGRLSDSVNYHFLCHWHEDMEFVYVVDGTMDYYVNGKSISLKTGDLILINSGRLHYAYSDTRKECHYYCVILHPSLITSNKKLYEKYISPIVSTCEPDYYIFKSDDDITKLILAIHDAKTGSSPSYELDVINLFQTLWIQLYHRTLPYHHTEVPDSDPDLATQREMVSFIYQNYSNMITLGDIAASGQVCRSKCCQIFKKYMGQSPMDFVNSYRLECSQQLLENTNMSITDICLACGFNHQSYFTKQFRLKYHCTPKSYRKGLT
ncbi:MAG: helix-turn-helix domain-containing protein [Lachnospiraceae bacterium]|nr:helix-turn-helix domain-containing protein [Lachnospiraceae bacterium]